MSKDQQDSINQLKNISLKEYSDSIKYHKLDLIDEYQIPSRHKISESINISKSGSIYNSAEQFKKRKYTLNVRPSEDNKYLKILIPFDLEQKKFFISKEELEIYDIKDYIQRTINKFNSMEEFHIHEDYKGTTFALMLKWFLILIFHICIGYCNVCLLQMGCFNIVFFAFLLNIHYLFNILVLNIFRRYFNKVQLKRLRSILNKENETEYCKRRKYTWDLGESGYWIQMNKSLE